MPSKKKIINPLTGRKITVGGAVHMKISKIIQYGGAGGATGSSPSQKPQTKQVPDTRKFDTNVLYQQSEKFFDKLAKSDGGRKPIPTKLAANVDTEMPIIPKSRYNLIGSNLPPAPAGSHSYYHHHSPFSQDFGDYVCLKKDTLRDVGMFLRDSMFRSVDNI